VSLNRFIKISSKSVFFDNLPDKNIGFLIKLNTDNEQQFKTAVLENLAIFKQFLVLRIKRHPWISGDFYQ
jgi:hypothetical protein